MMRSEPYPARFSSSSPLRKIHRRFSWLIKPILFISFYGFWVWAIRLLTLTLITYFTISPTSHFQDISDSFSSNEVSLMGLASLLFVALLCGLNPLTSTSVSEVISRERIEKGFLPGFVQGTFFAGGMLLAFLLTQVYRYLGYFIPLDEAPLELVNVLLRMAALGALAYCEEFIFHYKISKYLEGYLSNTAIAVLIGISYCSVKLLQFDLGTMHLITLFLVSVSLYFRAQDESQFARGAGFWAAILILFHPLLSLPIFGNNFSGILLIKYQNIAPTHLYNHSHDYFTSTPTSDSIIRILTGGAGGPLSSFAFQLLLILDIGRNTFRRKKKGI